MPLAHRGSGREAGTRAGIGMPCGAPRAAASNPGVVTGVGSLAERSIRAAKLCIAAVAGALVFTAHFAARRALGGGVAAHSQIA